MVKRVFLFFILMTGLFSRMAAQDSTWFRINLLGYTEQGSKIAVLCTKENRLPDTVLLTEAKTGKVIRVYTSISDYGAYGPFTHTARIPFTDITKPGFYFLKAGNIQSPLIKISDTVYKGRADFCLRYLRQQRNGFNPTMKDSCHTHDGYTLYGPMPDSSFIPVSGGWHDASDYLQYATTSANACWHLFAAYRDFKSVFTDAFQWNGLAGSNHIPDVMDEAQWGLDWLLKMNPEDTILFNQVGDDRDHMGMRLPKQDTNYYGRGLERPVYYVSGKPQQRGKFMNSTTGVSSIAGKYSSVYSIAAGIKEWTDPDYAEMLMHKSRATYYFGLKYPGYMQTASVRSPYIYAEENWADDMELAAAGLQKSSQGLSFARQEPVTPWLGKDTAAHYQWYPFINPGHFELARSLRGAAKKEMADDYREGIMRVWEKAKTNAFFRGIPFIWCSNNLTTAFAIQLYWYRQLSGDLSMKEFEQANLDWLLGCNPWGTSMIYGLPADADNPSDPHAAMTHIGHKPIDGGLVDGPVYTSIYKSLIGLSLTKPDAYAAFQSSLAVYHDDYGDYSTNEPTMDGTAILVYLLAAKEEEERRAHAVTVQDAIVRGDTTRKQISLVFTADEFFEGLPRIQQTLNQYKIKGSFFFTGRMYRDAKAIPLIKNLIKTKQYLGPHSDQHLLYCDWTKRDSLLVTKDSLLADLKQNYDAMESLGIHPENKLMIAPYEWWNSTVAAWCREKGIQLINFTPGIRTNADYTWPEMGASYLSSDKIMQLLKDTEKAKGLNGAILLIHAGTDPRRTDKLYNRLPEMIDWLKSKGYTIVPADQLLRGM